MYKTAAETVRATAHAEEVTGLLRVICFMDDAAHATVFEAEMAAAAKSKGKPSCDMSPKGHGICRDKSDTMYFYAGG